MKKILIVFIMAGLYACNSESPVEPVKKINYLISDIEILEGLFKEPKTV